MTNQYKYGRSKEQKVAQSLRGRGAKVQLSPGSKGAADLNVTFPTGTKWKVQVKSTRNGNPAWPSPKDLGRLKQSSSRTGATPVIAEVSPKGIQYKSARSGRSLKPPKTR
ncbi:MAG: hypothetical protein DRG63_13530 [Deltaproteobacteria bacterium]|nr:MAG: hypothetical protein DRG63_13530 [Deltaproteobacteria bacterium]